ncbi:hypothetical protein LJB81_00040 [Desulfovibrio sp. OttesenSCG-928-M14]|nr:hypothetical protein [Desulfovibrio sp. OttesenSCG-928-M14]
MKMRIYLLPLMLLLSFPVCVAAAGPETVYRYGMQGTINGTIPVSVWLEERDDIIVGEIVYTNTKEKRPIPLFGTTHMGTSNMVEIFPDGLITGSLSGVLFEGRFEGTWTAPDKVVEKGTRFERTPGKTYPILLSPSPVQAKSVDWGYDPDALEGEYRYSYGKNNAAGTVIIGKPKAGTVEYRLDAHIGAPSFNVAQIPMSGPGDTARETGELQGNFIYYERGPNCAVEIYLFSGFLVTRYPEGLYCEGKFGHGASAAGVFMKQKK